MNKLLIAIALCGALAACNKQDAAPADPAATPAPEASAPATPEAAAPADPAATTAPVNAGLPKECEDYLNRAKACFAKVNPQMAAQFQTSIDQAKAQWDAATDKASLAPACTQANEQFSQTVAMLKCE